MPRLHPLLLLAAATLVVSSNAAAQGRRWTGNAEAALSFFSGNTNQRSLFAKTGVSRKDSVMEWKSDLSFSYADADRDSLPREVTRRTWLGSLAVDFHPYARFSPFMFGTWEASYEKRILDRVGLGIGGKIVIIRNDATLTDFSLAMLSERTRPSDRATDPSITSFARWSSRFRARHKFDDRLSASHETMYQPRVTAVDSYTLKSTTGLAYQLRESTNLTISYMANYDSEAIARGARSNDDGQLLMGVKTTF
ncbi:MAG TPA: DUF481 domain-containing protein [Gemmatimonadaceae bacterium]|nr:DUF481 domain-containing protein [Gemmatimonadaceae bacterium]